MKDFYILWVLSSIEQWSIVERNSAVSSLASSLAAAPYHRT